MKTSNYKHWKTGEVTTYYEPEVSDMVGRTFTDVRQVGDDIIEFECDDGVFTFCHHQDCCEGVSIESIVGDLSDLVGEPLLTAEESTNSDDPPRDGYVESFTWTFYKFSTRKGYVDIRWLGSSNGYYSESVDLDYTPKGATK